MFKRREMAWSHAVLLLVRSVMSHYKIILIAMI